ncbi:MAG: DUF4105 domain-containing protein [Candidatus Pacebacteria bacterium]|nr:DUF4105 domain-containing protein [Candidatus Paceibacterota bacterium]
MHNVRNFRYEGELVVVKDYYDKIVDVRDITSVDLVTYSFPDVGIDVIHSLLLFHFKDGSTTTISVEARREKDEMYNVIGSLFRAYELAYIFADGQDAISQRVERGLVVYALPLKLSQAERALLFLTLAEDAERIRLNPAFYNVLVNNCIYGTLQSVFAVSGDRDIYIRNVFSMVSVEGVYDYLFRVGLLDIPRELPPVSSFRVSERR